MPPDLAARKLLVAAYMYYNIAKPCMTDAEYDKLGQYVYKHYHELEPDRQFMLGDRRTMRTSGAGFKFSKACVWCCRSLFPHEEINTGWKFNKLHQITYQRVTG